MNDDTGERTEFSDQPPETRAADVAHGVARAVISAIPAVGGPAVELLETLIRTPIEGRRDKWVQSIAEALKGLEDGFEGFKDEQLQQNEVFTTTLLGASNIALRNHQQEKIEALKNAVLNAAITSNPDEDLQAIFLSLVDRFTQWHLRILRLFDDPKGSLDEAGVDYSHYYMGGASQVLEDRYAEMKGNREFYDLVVNDLSSAGLFGIGSLHGAMSKEGMLAARTTQMGKRFIKFISEPAKET